MAPNEMGYPCRVLLSISVPFTTDEFDSELSMRLVSRRSCQALKLRNRLPKPAVRASALEYQRPQRDARYRRIVLRSMYYSICEYKEYLQIVYHEEIWRREERAVILLENAMLESGEAG